MRKVLISTLLLSYITCAFIITSPPSAFKFAFTKMVKPALAFPGLYKTYTLFCPDAVKYNFDCRAVIRFADGTNKTWVHDWQQVKKENQERQPRFPWQNWQWAGEGAVTDKNLMTDAARYIAWVNRNPSNPPVEITLYVEYMQIPPPANAPVPPSEQRNGSRELLRYTVVPRDLL